MDDFISTMVWQLFFFSDTCRIIFLYFGVLSSCICPAAGLDYQQWRAGRSIWIDLVCKCRGVQVCKCASVQVQRETKWNGRSARFEKSETMMLAWTTINRGLSASVRTSISQMQPMAGTMTHGGREPEKCIMCFITYFLTCTLRQHIYRTQIDNGVGRLLIWWCPLALGFPSIRWKKMEKYKKT